MRRVGISLKREKQLSYVHMLLSVVYSPGEDPYTYLTELVYRSNSGVGESAKLFLTIKGEVSRSLSEILDQRSGAFREKSAFYSWIGQVYLETGREVENADITKWRTFGVFSSNGSTYLYLYHQAVYPLL